MGSRLPERVEWLFQQGPNVILESLSQGWHTETLLSTAPALESPLLSLHTSDGAFKRPDCVKHILYNVECFPSKVPNGRKSVTFVALQRNRVLFKEKDNRTLGVTSVALENPFMRPD